MVDLNTSTLDLLATFIQFLWCYLSISLGVENSTLGDLLMNTFPESILVEKGKAEYKME